MQGINLGSLPGFVHPRAGMVDWLAGEFKRMQEKGIKKPFVYCELYKWLPTWCVESGEGAVVIFIVVSFPDSCFVQETTRRMTTQWLTELLKD